MYGIPVCNLYLFFFIKKTSYFCLFFFTPHFLKRRDFSSWRRISCGKATKPLPMLVKSLKEEEAAFSMTTTTTTTMPVVARWLAQHHHHQRPRRYESSFYRNTILMRWWWFLRVFFHFGVSPLFLSFGRATLVRLLSLFLSLSNDDDDDDAWWNDNRHR